MAAITFLGEFLNAVRTSLMTVSSIIKNTRFNRSLFTAGIGAYTSYAILIIVVVFGVTLFKEITGIGLSPIEKRRLRKAKKTILDRVDHKALIMAGGALVIAVFQGIMGTTFSFLMMMSSTIITWIGPMAILTLGGLFMSYSVPILQTITVFYQGLLSPINNILMAGLSLVSITFYMVYPITVGIMKFLTSIPIRVLQVAIICIFDVLYDVVRLTMLTVFSLTTAIVYWGFSGVLTTELPLLDTFQHLGELLAVLSTKLIECACHILRYLTGGITRALTQPSFAYMMTNAVNFGLTFLSYVIIQPTMSLFTISVPGNKFFWPNFDFPYPRWIGTLDNAGIWLQNATVIGFDIWVVGGNGTIIAMVNGSHPMPTDGLEYLIRFLQSVWAQTILRGLDLFLIMPIWQAAYWFQRVPLMSQPDGNTAVWNIEWIYNEAHFTANGIGTVIATIGICNADPLYPPVEFAQLISVIRAVINLARVVWDCLFGEIYYLRMDISQYGFLVFTGEYIETSPVYAAYKQDIIWVGQAYGCLIAYISSYLGVSFQGVVEVVFYWIWDIAALFITKLRVIFTGANPIILDQIDVGPMEASMLKIAEIGGIFWQFQPGASESFCRSQVSFLCATGLAVMGAVTILDRLIVTLVALVIEIIQFVSGSIVNNSIQTLQIPKDIACDPSLTVVGNPSFPGASCQIPIVLDLYDTGCRIGVAVATAIPFPLPCLSESPNACYVSQFPNYGQNTFSICFGTFGCRVGRWIGIIPDFFLSVFNWITNFTWNAGTGGSENDNFIVNIFKKFLYLFTFEFSSPLCPLGHLLDCIWSLLLKNGGGNKDQGPATGLLCLISAFLVVLQRDLGDLIIVFIRIVVFFLSLIFGVPAVGNLSELGDLIAQFFVVFGTFIKQFGLMILSFILSTLFTFLKSVCDFFKNIFTDIDCTELDVAQNIIFDGLQVEPLNSPANINYKRDLEAIEQNRLNRETNANNNKKSALGGLTGYNCTSFFRSTEYEAYFYRDVLRGAPVGLEHFCFDSPHPPKASIVEPPVTVNDMVANRNAPPSLAGSFDILTRKPGKQAPVGGDNYRRNARSLYLDDSTSPSAAVPLLRIEQQFILEHFGAGPEDTEDTPAYMAEQVYWSTDSDCLMFFQRSKTYKLSELGPADRHIMDKCIRQKFEGLRLQKSNPLFAWVPEDILYNTWKAVGSIVLKLLRISAVALQFFWDKQTKPERLLTAAYQRTWVTFKMDTSFYNDTLLRIFQNSSTTEEGYQRVGWAVGNMTFNDYVRRNFPSMFTANGSREGFVVRDGDRVTDPLKSFGDLSYDFTMSLFNSSINRKAIESFRNRTYSFFFNYTGTASADGDLNDWRRQAAYVSYEGHYYDLRNRTHLLKSLGPDVVRAIDSFQTTQGLYGLFSRFVGILERSTAILSSKNVTLIKEAFMSNFGGGSGSTTSTDPNVAQKRHIRWEEFYPSLSQPEKTTDNNLKGGEGFEDNPEQFKHGVFAASSIFATESKKVLSAAYSNFSWIMDNLRKGMEDRLIDLYSSPAFEKELTPLGSLVATFASGIHSGILGGKSPKSVLTPWCVAKASRVHNMTFAEVRKIVQPRDCRFYETLEFLRGGNYTYSDFTKEFYKMDTNGQFIPIKELPEDTNSKTFFELYIPALNAEAVLVRNIPSMLYNSIMKEIWAYGYLLFGDGKGGESKKGSDSAVDRMVEIMLDIHPTFDEWKQSHNLYEDMLKLLKPELREEIKRRNHIRFDDFEVWEAWKKVPGGFMLEDYLKRVREPSMIKEMFIQEQFHYQNHNGLLRHNNDGQRRIRAELLGTKEGKVVRDIRELVRSAKSRLLEEEQMKQWSYMSRDSTYYNRFSLLQSDPPNPITDILDNFGLNLTRFYEMHCFTDQMWLCEECYILDALLGRSIDIINYMNYFYSNQLPDIMTGEMATYQYFVGQTTGNLSNPRALIGKFKNSQPWIPILNEPIGVVLQFSQSEIDNGLDWFAWLWQILGGRIPDLIQNGTCYNMMNNYNFANSSQTTPTANVGWEIIRILYYDFDLPICALWDTFMYLLENSIPNIGSYIVDHYILCNWGTAIDGSARIYSLAAGAIILGTFLIGATVALLLLGSVFGSIVIVPIVLLWSTYWIFFLVSVYNWSFGCFPIVPNNLVDDAINLWAYTPTLGGPCSIILGAFINSTDYNANTCTNMTRLWSMSSGADLGFTNPQNVIEFARVAYDIDWKVLNYIEDVYTFLMGGTGPTFDYSDYNTDPIRHRNYTAWFFVAVPTFGALGFVVAWLMSLLVLAALGSSLPIAQSLLLWFYGVLQFLEKLGRVKY